MNAAPAMSAPSIPSDRVIPGDRVHLYAALHYNQRGTVTAVRPWDALGRVSVRLDGSERLVCIHDCELEITRRPQA